MSAGAAGPGKSPGNAERSVPSETSGSAERAGPAEQSRPEGHGPPDRQWLDGAASVFAALGDGTRLSLLVRLGDDAPSSISALAEGSAVSRQAVTKHLEALEAAGLARSWRRGRERLWEPRTDRLDRIGRDLQTISAHWDAALDRLRSMVEADTED